MKQYVVRYHEIFERKAIVTASNKEDAESRFREGNVDDWGFEAELVDTQVETISEEL